MSTETAGLSVAVAVEPDAPAAQAPSVAVNARGFGAIAMRVSALTLFSQMFGFISSVVIARQLGASHTTDAYFLGLSVPTFVYGVFLAAIRAGAIPALTHEARDAGAFAKASSELISVTLVATLLLSLLAVGVAAALLPLTVGSPALVGPTRVKALELMPLGVLGAMIAALAAILAVRSRFAAAAAVLAFDPILRIALLVPFASILGTNALVIANLGGNALAVVALWALVQRDGVPLRLRSPLRSPFVRRTLGVTVPLLLCQVIVGTNPVIDRAMTGGLSPGSITTLELGFRLFAIPVTLIGATLIGPLTATWSARKAAGGWPALRDSVNRGIQAFTIAVPPLLVLGIALRHQLVGLLYHGGAYSAHATDQTATVLAMFEIGAPAMLVTIAFSTLFVIEEQTKFVLATGVINFVLNVALNFVLRGPLGAGGIALSTSLTYTIVLSLYIASARRRWPGVMLPFSGAAGARVIAGTAVMALAALATSSIFAPDTDRIRLVGQVLVVALAGVVSYTAILLTDGRWRRIVDGRLRQALSRIWPALAPEQADRG